MKIQTKVPDKIIALDTNIKKLHYPKLGSEVFQIYFQLLIFFNRGHDFLNE